MSAPRTKRQFAGAASDPAQRQITSFFSSTSPNPYAIDQIPSPQSSSATSLRATDSASNLPGSVQSNLLSVGMRIRKSVPEGYKTGSYCNNAFALWDENDTDPATTTAINNMGEGQRSRANAFSSPRELLPFCGIHKVGGMDTQSQAFHQRPIIPSMLPSIHANAVPTTTAPAYQPPSSFGSSEMSEDEDVPGLTSSQGSVESNASSSEMASSRTRKRFFVEDEDEEIPGQLNLWRYGNDIHNLASVGCHNGRAMAVPRKGRLRAKFSDTASAMPGVATGQENLMLVDSDFEEAEFLEGQGTWEVMMSDA
ncbi:ribonucleotide reductase inhibitor-domain-containing protein [Xylaria arbuscula]|nr:ribonucleotide reductase inhibitor-domain-containing protein [Xylaria arbuscula]